MYAQDKTEENHPGTHPFEDHPWNDDEEAHLIKYLDSLDGPTGGY